MQIIWLQISYLAPSYSSDPSSIKIKIKKNRVTASITVSKIPKYEMLGIKGECIETLISTYLYLQYKAKNIL